MYYDLKISNKDLVFDDLGKLVLVSNKDSIKQSLMDRLNTLKGQLFYDYSYGMDYGIEKLKVLDKYTNDIQVLVTDCLTQDYRVLKANIINVYRTDFAEISVDIEVILTNQTIINITYNF
jgi:hypothetical protein